LFDPVPQIARDLGISDSRLLRPSPETTSITAVVGYVTGAVVSAAIS
jgi:hypothetical protein